MNTAPTATSSSTTMTKNDTATKLEHEHTGMIVDGASSSSSTASSSSEYQEEDLANLVEAMDKFDSDRGPTVSIESSSTPFVLEVAPRNGGFTKDPLFQANTLYEGEMSTKQVDAYCSKTILGTSASTPIVHDRRSSWTDSVVRLLTGSQE